MNKAPYFFPCNLPRITQINTKKSCILSIPEKIRLLSISFWGLLWEENHAALFLAYKAIQSSINYFNQISFCTQKFLGLWLSLIFGSDSVWKKKTRAEIL